MLWKKLLLIALFNALIIVLLHAQGENNIWHFGEDCVIDFNSGVAVSPAGAPSAISTSEGCASVSDANGNLLFYTDGEIVWNATHAPMPNGTGLAGNSSTSQSAIIVKKPTCDSVYYIIANDHVYGVFGFDGMRYSEVDMTLNGGLGDIIPATKNTLILARNTEKMAATWHSNGENFWIVGIEDNTNDIHCYKGSSTGFDAPITSTGLMPYTMDGYRSQGQLKFSTDGTRLAMTTLGGNAVIGGVFTFLPGFLQVFDFDASTGIISNPILILDSTSFNYGIEFSPDGSKLYYTNMCAVSQFDLTAGTAAAIAASKVDLSDPDCSFAGSGVSASGVQLGPDDKVYVTYFVPSSPPTSIGVINNPNAAGLASDYQDKVIPAGGDVSINFPQKALVKWVAPENNVSLSNDTIACSGETIVIDGKSTGTNNWSDGSTGNQLMVSTSGEYWLENIDGYCVGRDTININFNPLPTVSLPSDTTLCDGQNVQVSAASTNTDNILWSTGSASNTIDVNSNGFFWVQAENNCGTQNDTIVVDYIDCTNNPPLNDCEIVVPNAFSPNGDNVNDDIKPLTDCADIEILSFSIYNRWGEQVYETNSINISWDGKLRDLEQPIGTYVWLLKTNLNNSTYIYTGNINLLR